MVFVVFVDKVYSFFYYNLHPQLHLPLIFHQQLSQRKRLLLPRSRDRKGKTYSQWDAEKFRLKRNQVFDKARQSKLQDKFVQIQAVESILDSARLTITKPNVCFSMSTISEGADERGDDREGKGVGPNTYTDDIELTNEGKLKGMIK